MPLLHAVMCTDSVSLPLCSNDNDDSGDDGDVTVQEHSGCLDSLCLITN